MSTSFIGAIMRRTPALSSVDDEQLYPKQLGWIMLTALGIGATIGAGIFAMPGMIARKAGPRHYFISDHRTNHPNCLNLL